MFRSRLVAFQGVEIKFWFMTIVFGTEMTNQTIKEQQLSRLQV